MFKPILLSAALSCLSALTAQARTYYEYWFDNDIDNRRTAESTVGETRLTLTVGDMPEGAHVLFVRASIDDEWSATSSRLFVKPYAQSVAPIDFFECWIDNDYAGRTTGSVSNGNAAATLPIEGLTPGVHTIAMRCRDAGGNWTASSIKLFTISRRQDKADATDYEYWLDGDIANRVGGKLTDGGMSADISLEGMTSGVHTLSFRIRDSRGTWSAASTRLFTILQPTVRPNLISAYEFWFDDDTDSRQCVILETPASPLDMTVSLPTDALSNKLTHDNMIVELDETGRRTLKRRNLLSMRLRDGNNNWSEVRTDTFTTAVDNPSADLTGMIINPDATLAKNGWDFGNAAASVNTSEHWSGEERPYFSLATSTSSGWNNSMTQTVTGLPPGSYLLEVTARTGKNTQLTVSACDAVLDFDKTGTTGGSVWETAGDDSDERNVNGGKGFGWTRMTLPIFSDGNDITIKAQAQASGAGEICDISDFRLAINSVAALDVVLPDNVSLPEYKDMRIVVTSGTRQMQATIGGKRKYSFSGLSTTTPCDVRITNRFGHVVASKESVALEDGQNNVTISDFKPLRNINIAVVDTAGRDFTAVAQTAWLDARGNKLASGCRLEKIPDGAELRYSIALSDSLSLIYRSPIEGSLTVSDTTINQTVSMKTIERISIAGKVTDSQGLGLYGAKIVATQKAGGKDAIVSTTSRADGSFSLWLKDDSCRIVASMPGYVDAERCFCDFHTSTDLGRIVLDKVSGIVIRPDITFVHSAENGTKPQEDRLNARAANIGYMVRNLTTDIDSLRMHNSYGCLIVTDAAEGDTLRLTAVSLDGTFDAANAEFVIGQPTDTINAKLRVVEHGGIKAAYSSTANRGVDAMLYGADGNLRGVKSYEAAQTEFSGLPAGRYTLVSIGSGSGLGTLQSLDILGRLGLADGEDYIADEINVTDGVIDKAEVGTVPLIDGKLPSYTTDETMLSANKSEIFAGQFVTLETNIKFREEFADAVGDVRLILSLPENFAYVDNSAIIGQALASCVDDGSTVTVDVPAEDLGKRLRLCVTATGEGVGSPSAHLEFECDGQRSQSVGSVEIKSTSLSIDAPSKTATSEFTVSGMTQPRARVEIKDANDGDAVIGTTNALADGSWCAACSLHEPYNLSRHEIYANVVTTTGVTISSEKKTVTFDVAANYVKTVTMLNISHRNSAPPFKPYEEKVVFDFLTHRLIGDNYWWWPQYPKFTFIVDLHDNSPRRVDEVGIEVKTTAGKDVRLTADYDSIADRWVATHNFNSQCLPVNVGVSFHSNDSVYFDQNQLDAAYNIASTLASEQARYEAEVDSIGSRYVSDSCESVEDLEQVWTKYFEEIDSVAGLTDEPVELPDNILEAIDKIGNARTNEEFDAALTEYEQLMDEEFEKFVEPDTVGLTDVELPDEWTFTVGNTLVSYRHLPKKGDDSEELPAPPAPEITVGSAQTDSEGKRSTMSMGTDDEGNTYFYTERKDVASGSGDTAGGDNPPDKPGDNPGDKPGDKPDKATIPPKKENITVKNLKIDSYNPPVPDPITWLAALNNQWSTTVSTGTGMKIDDWIDASTRMSKLIKQYQRGAHESLNSALKTLKSISPEVAIDRPWAVQRANTLMIRHAIFFREDLKKRNKLKLKIANLQILKKAASGAFGAMDFLSQWSDWVTKKSALEELESDLYLCSATNQHANIKKQVESHKKKISDMQLTKAVVNTGFLAGDILTSPAVPVTMTLMGAQIAANTLFDKHIDKLYVQAVKDLKGMVDWDKCRKEKPWAFPPEQSGCPDPGTLIDPSGYVYEAVTSNRLEGVTATIYELAPKENIYGDKFEKVEKWDAEAYSQVNPQITDESGIYQWDVPEGKWQVRFTKPGYEPATTDWLEVQPPRLDVNVPMTHAVNPTGVGAEGYESGVTVTFDKYMTPASFGDRALTVARQGADVEGRLQFVNLETDPLTGNAYASKVKFVPVKPFVAGEQVTVTAAAGVESYASMPMLDDFVRTVTIQPEMHFATTDTTINLAPGETQSVEITLLPEYAARGRKIKVRNASASIVDADTTTLTVGSEGKTSLTLTGRLPGTAPVELTVEGTDLTSTVNVNVGASDDEARMPWASVRTGTALEAGTPVALFSDTEGASIYYTLDGSCPCDEATRRLYTEPLIITEPVIVRAQAVKDGLESSEVATFEYLIRGSSIIVNEADDLAKVSTEGNEIVVSGCDHTSCQIYDLTGKNVWRANDATGTLRITLQKGQFYIVRIQQSRKVKVAKVIL